MAKRPPNTMHFLYKKLHTKLYGKLDANTTGSRFRSTGFRSTGFRSISFRSIGFIPKFSLVFVFAFISLCTEHASALEGATNHSSKQKQWYQIELYVFATESEKTSRSETWRERDTLGIQYPFPILELLTPQQESLSHQTILLSRPLSNEETPPNEQAQRTEKRHYDFGSEAYLKLPDEMVSIIDIKTKLKRSRQYRMLYEAAWRQPIEDFDNSIPILIQGGEQYGDYFELEGTIRLSVSRYLHVHTDLWLSQFARKLNLDGPEAQPTDLSLTFSNTDVSVVSSSAHANYSVNPAIVTNNEGLNDWQNQFNLASAHSLISSEYESIRTVQLKQSRRMRSGELHYLDHPLFGMIVQVTPYDKPEQKTNQENFEELPPWEQEIIKQVGTEN